MQTLMHRKTKWLDDILLEVNRAFFFTYLVICCSNAIYYYRKYLCLHTCMIDLAKFAVLVLLHLANKHNCSNYPCFAKLFFFKYMMLVRYIVHWFIIGKTLDLSLLALQLPCNKIPLRFGKQMTEHFRHIDGQLMISMFRHLIFISRKKY